MDGDAGGLIKEVRRDGDTVVVVVEGEITLDASPVFHRALVELVAAEPKRMVLNLADVAHIDSAGVGTLVEIFRRLHKNDGNLLLVGLRQRVLGVFEVTRLDQFFTICDTEDEALQA